MISTSNESKAGSTASRKPYKKPKLEKYGDLREITQSNASGPMLDGMSGTAMQQTV